MSLVAERKFFFKHKRTKDKVKMILPHGSLLVLLNQQIEPVIAGIFLMYFGENFLILQINIVLTF
jgi:hypothetical protein